MLYQSSLGDVCELHPWNYRTSWKRLKIWWRVEEGARKEVLKLHLKKIYKQNSSFKIFKLRIDIKLKKKKIISASFLFLMLDTVYHRSILYDETKCILFFALIPLYIFIEIHHRQQPNHHQITQLFIILLLIYIEIVKLLKFVNLLLILL